MASTEPSFNNTATCALRGPDSVPAARQVGDGTTVLDGADAALLPFTLVAITVHVVLTPLTAVTTIGEAAALLPEAPQVAV